MALLCKLNVVAVLQMVSDILSARAIPVVRNVLFWRDVHKPTISSVMLLEYLENRGIILVWYGFSLFLKRACCILSEPICWLNQLLWRSSTYPYRDYRNGQPDKGHFPRARAQSFDSTPQFEDPTISCPWGIPRSAQFSEGETLFVWTSENLE